MLHALRPLALLSMTVLAVAPSYAAHAQDVGAAKSQRDPSGRMAEDGNWKFELGASVGYGPKYEGSDEYEVIPIPQLSVEYKDGLFFANVFDGIGSYPLRGEHYKVGASIGLAFGRDEDDSDDLRGMGDLDMSPTANLMGEYDIGPLTLSGKLSKGNDDCGLTAELGVGTMVPVTKKLMVMAKVGAKWADEDHMISNFGVSPAQSARSGYARYSPKSGFKSVGVSIVSSYSITDHWDGTFMVVADQLIGDAADSPIVKKEFQLMTMLGVSYKF